MDDGGLIAHAFVERREQGDGVGDEVARSALVRVQEPLGELELRMQSGALGELGIGGAVRGSHIRFDDIALRFGRR